MNLLRSLLLASVLPAVASALVIESTFDSDADGWTKAPGSDADSTTVWVASGGNPGGFLRHNEAADGLGDRVAAPSKFLGDLSAFIGGTLSFDIRTNTISNSLASESDVVVTGTLGSLRFDLPNPSTAVWSSRLVPLTHDAGWIVNASNLPPTPAQFSEIFSSVTALTLLADYRSGPEMPVFDTIRLETIPEPAAAAACLALASAGSALVRRRRIS